MATQEELDTEGEDEETNLTLMASIFSNSESEANSYSYPEDAEHVFSHLSTTDLSTLCYDLMERC